MSEIKSYFLGSVSNKILHGLTNRNIYLVGEKEGPVLDILVPVDGSEYSMKAVEHAVCITKYIKDIRKVTLLRVINLSLYLERVQAGIDPEEEAKEILDKAKKRFLEQGIKEELVETKISVGFPKDEVVKEINQVGYNLIIMGRKGRSAFKDLVLGGVSSAVINECLEPTIAIVNL
ncbi:universal stress protein [Thermodesulfobacterium thermophilum]|uniref:universal stress protein n=1 Tax=Thermodesulfobacterium thermophilum TaxID=886 RepID=UPI00041C9AD6|nr:universal stress protein [Thermodesulfobacterium thermophilum]